MRPIRLSRAVAFAIAALLGAIAPLAGPAVARAATLTIEIQSGVGAVDLSNGAVACRRDSGDALPKTCPVDVGDQDPIALHAMPGDDHRFFQWVADNPDCGREPDCDVAMGGVDQTVQVGFVPGRTLNILPVGEGTVTVSKAAVDLANGYEAQSECTRSMEDEAGEPNTGGCRFTYLPGTTVTLIAVPGSLDDGTRTTFARWSPFECPGVDACTVTISDEDVTVAAAFDPLHLALRVAGTGTVAVAPGGFTCSATALDDPFKDCPFIPYDSGTTVTLTATTPDVHWAVGCQDVSSDGQSCTTTVDRDPWWVGAAFGGAALDPAQFPPKIRVRFRVIVGGSGDGSVHGDRIDCGTRCSNTYDYGDRERLRADPRSGSRFDGWVGGCGRDPTCTLPVGRITTVRAVFVRTAQQSGTDRKDSAKRLSVRRVRLKALGRRGRRRVVLVVAVNESATGRLRLLRAHRQVAAQTYRLRSGRNRLVLRVPRKARGGRYRVVLKVRAASGTRKVSGRVRLRR